MIEYMRIKSKKSILLYLTCLTGVCLDELMLKGLFFCINTSKRRLHFGFTSYQTDNPIIQQEIVSHRRKPAPTANMHSYLLANVIINKKVIPIYDLPLENMGISGKVIRAPPAYRA